MFIGRVLPKRRSEPGLALRRTSWSLVDQGVVSLGTFLVSITLARKLSSPDYGAFAVLLTVAFNLQLLNIWLVAYPLGVRLADAKGVERARLSTSSLVLVALLCVPISAIIGAALAAFGRADLILPAIAWFALWQIQQATRRALFADLNHREAVVGDVLSSLGQVLIVNVVAAVGNLSLASALYCMAAASVLGAIHQIFQLRLVVSGLYGPRRWFVQNASLGVWSLATGLVSSLRLSLLFWLLAAAAGAAVVGSLQAALNIFNLLNPVQFGLASLIPQVTAIAFARGGKLTAWHVARPYILIALPPTLIYVVLAVMFSPLLLWAFYGNSSPYLQLGNLFPPLAVFAAAMMMTELVNCYLLGIGEARLALKINLVGFAAVAILAGPLLALFGALPGTCMTLAAADVIRLVAALVWLRRLLGSAG